MIKTISSIKAYEYLSHFNDDAILIDVRTIAELHESGICDVLKVVHIPYDWYNEKKFIDQVCNEIKDRDKNFFLFCRSGKRSFQAALLMQNNGFNCSNIEDGLIGNETGKGWINNKLPIRSYIG